MTHKMGAKGQVVIPKAIREETGIEPGDEVVFESDGSDVRVRRVDQDPRGRAAALKTLRGLWSDTAGGGTDDLLEQRRRDRELEERKAERQDVGRSR
jgi:AbrB family looped-hinge helix DNA binding protein